MNVIHKVSVVHEFVPHARRREVKSEALIDAAMAVVAREGIESLTLARVAGEHGLVTTAIYRYFPSKGALLAALHRRAIQLLHERFQAEHALWSARGRRARPETLALAKLFAVARFYVGLAESMPDAFRLLSMMLADPRPLVDDDAVRVAAPAVLGFMGEAAALFDEAVRVGALSPGVGLTRTAVFWASLHGLTQLAKLSRLSPEGPTPRSLSDECAATLLRGMGASEDSLRRAERAANKLCQDGEAR